MQQYSCYGAGPGTSSIVVLMTRQYCVALQLVNGKATCMVLLLTCVHHVGAATLDICGTAALSDCNSKSDCR